MADPNLFIMVGIVFCLAGFVKGMVGLGLPTVSLGLLSIIVDLPTAMVLCPLLGMRPMGTGKRFHIPLMLQSGPFTVPPLLVQHEEPDSSSLMSSRHASRSARETPMRFPPKITRLQVSGLKRISKAHRPEGRFLRTQGLG